MHYIGITIACFGLFLLGYHIGWTARDYRAQDQMEQIRKWWRK